MKRVSITLEEIAAFDNLAQAAQQAARAKRGRPDIQRFFQHFDTHLHRLAQDIRNARLPYGRFRQFTIRDPKPRMIHAACFEDRIGPAHMKVDTFGKPDLHTLHIAFKVNRISAEAPRSINGSCLANMAIRLL